MVVTVLNISQKAMARIMAVIGDCNLKDLGYTMTGIIEDEKYSEIHNDFKHFYIRYSAKVVSGKRGKQWQMHFTKIAA